MRATPFAVAGPGKLYVAGEYAVVTPGQPAILIAVDRYMTVTVTDAEPAATPAPTADLLAHDHCVAAVQTHEFGTDYALAAWLVMDKLRAERGLERRPVDFHFSSTLRSEAGEKYGLGSSGAATMAVITAVNELYGLGLTAIERIKLGILASIEISPRASGGDLAAGALGGWVYYQAPDREKLPRVLTDDGSVTQALTGPAWIPLRARRIPTPEDVQVLIGWTGSPAQTDDLVTQATTNGNGFDWEDAFLRPSAANVTSLLLALAEAKFALIHSGIRTARTLLARMAEHTATLVETPALTDLIETAQGFAGASAKTSGAGGGDCGIVLAEPWVNAVDIYTAWSAHGIHPLQLSVTQLGAGLKE
ncbi:phosphomevalonate kinase [Enteractinococcus coprophilus]|uniref:phosphomevalonate kinase n=1 Tax=Enteractinococcus coprophilus TaxID=1027633 RepID=A0A543AMC3_9MICC|nr:phosphomevalonate kinase [Enteractinococcus coprophilus]TQL73753.1 phosphomevalonate kinase [Enteractinococcus coprophilus]